MTTKNKGLFDLNVMSHNIYNKQSMKDYKLFKSIESFLKLLKKWNKSSIFTLDFY